MTMDKSTKAVIIIILLTILYFNFIPLLFGALKGEVIAGLAFLLAIITQQMIGDKVLKYLK